MGNAIKRSGILIGFFACIVGMGFAQNVDHKMFGVEMGVGFAYDVASGNVDNASTVGIHLSLSDSLVAGFLFHTSPGVSLPSSASFLVLDYGVADRIGFTLMLGRDTGALNLLTGVGAYYNIFERKIQDSLVNIVKTRVEYTFDPSGSFGSGDLFVGLSVGTGI